MSDHTVPSPRQVEFQDWEFGVFIHFGLRTFYEGYMDFDSRCMDAATFNPSSLDCRQWAKTAADAGAKYMVMTAKHHDGFANWPTKLSKFSVMSSTWKNGQGDVVSEYTDACREYNLKVGLYYSPFDADAPCYDNPSGYDDFFINQISELLTNYGQIDIIWFDGCGSGEHKYDWPRITGEIRRMQPEILIFNMGDPDFRWVGNEIGLAQRPIWNVVDQLDLSINAPTAQSLNGSKWLPPECDFRMRQKNWFFSEKDEHTVKSVRELMGLYDYSVGRGCNMLLNIGPDRRGLLPDTDTRRLLEFGQQIHKEFSTPEQATVKSEESTLVLELEQATLIDRVIISEDITFGEHVKKFCICQRECDKDWILYEGRNIGHKAICRFPPLQTEKLFLKITEASGDIHIKDFKAFAIL